MHPLPPLPNPPHLPSYPEEGDAFADFPTAARNYSLELLDSSTGRNRLRTEYNYYITAMKGLWKKYSDFSAEPIIQHSKHLQNISQVVHSHLPILSGDQKNQDEWKLAKYGGL